MREWKNGLARNKGSIMIRGLIGVALLLRGFDIRDVNGVESQALLIIGATLLTLSLETARHRSPTL
jgi:hypothetical protein